MPLKRWQALASAESPVGMVTSGRKARWRSVCNNRCLLSARAFFPRRLKVRQDCWIISTTCCCLKEISLVLVWFHTLPPRVVALWFLRGSLARSVGGLVGRMQVGLGWVEWVHRGSVGCGAKRYVVRRRGGGRGTFPFWCHRAAGSSSLITSSIVLILQYP